MGATQSRGGKGRLDSPRTHRAKPAGGYFILIFKEVKIKIVNIGHGELQVLGNIIKQHCKAVKEGWDRNLSYSVKLDKPERNYKSKLIPHILLSLYKEGWEPMPPIDTAGNVDNTHQTSICFRHREDPLLGRLTGSTYSLGNTSTASKDVSNDCLCIITQPPSMVTFHSVPNTVLHEMVTRLHQDWEGGVKGVSAGVASVIGDYTTNMPPTINMVDQVQKVIQLQGSPWDKDTDIDKHIEETEKINLCMIGVLTRSGFKLSMPINIEPGCRLYFFTHEPEEDQVKIPTFSKAVLEGKEPQPVCQPMVTKRKTSFYNSSHSVKNRIRASLRRKTFGRAGRAETDTAWWQQTSIDTSHQE